MPIFFSPSRPETITAIWKIVIFDCQTGAAVLHKKSDFGVLIITTAIMLASGIHTGGLQDVRNSLKEGKRIGSRREKQLFPPPQPLKQPLQARINEALSPNQPNRIFRTRVASPGETFGGSNGIGLTARERASTWRDQSWSLSRRQHCKKTASSILRVRCSCVGPARS